MLPQRINRHSFPPSSVSAPPLAEESRGPVVVVLIVDEQVGASIKAALLRFGFKRVELITSNFDNEKNAATIRSADHVIVHHELGWPRNGQQLCEELDLSFDRLIGICLEKPSYCSKHLPLDGDVSVEQIDALLSQIFVANLLAQ